MENKTGTKKKSNPYLKLVILVLVLAALVIGYKLLTDANKKQQQEKLEAERAALASDTPITVAQHELTSMTALSYTPTGGEPLSFSVVNGAWRWDGDANFPLNATTLAYMGTNIASITALRAVDGGKLADFGLEEPSCTVTVSYGAEKHTYGFGDYNGFSGAYYLLADGKVYLTEKNLEAYFDYTLDDLIARDSIPSADWTTKDYVTAVTVSDGTRENTITDADGVKAALDALDGVNLREIADYYADEQEKAALGFDGSRGVTVNYRKAFTSTDANGNSSTNYIDTSYSLMLGAETESGCYASPASSSIVYLLTAEELEALFACLDPVPAEE